MDKLNMRLGNAMASAKRRLEAIEIERAVLEKEQAMLFNHIDTLEGIIEAADEVEIIKETE